MRTLKVILFYLLSLTWGIIMTLLGIVVALGLLIAGHKPHLFHHYIYFKVGKNWGGFECGPIFVTDSTPTLHTKQHEAGHGIQNIIFGPLMPFIVSIPSMIRYWYRELQERKWKKKLDKKKITYREYYDWYRSVPSYSSIWFEHHADNLGKRYRDE